MNFILRQKKLREHLATTRFDALLISHLPNIRYLCGFTGSAGFLLVEESGSVFFTDVRYDTQGREEVKGAKVVIARKPLLSAVAEWIGSRRQRSKGWTIGIESEHMTVAERKRLTDLLPRGRRLQEASAAVERARMVKDADELQKIRAAVELGASLFDRALAVLRPGVKETDVAAEMEYAARRGRSRGNVVSNDHRFRAKISFAAWPGFGASHRAGRVRSVRFRCYTRRLLFGPDPHCMGGAAPALSRKTRALPTNR